METFQIDGYKSHVSSELVDYIRSKFDCKYPSFEAYEDDEVLSAQEKYDRAVNSYADECSYSLEDFDDDDIYEVHLESEFVSISIHSSNTINFKHKYFERDEDEKKFEYHLDIYEISDGELILEYHLCDEEDIMNFIEAVIDYINPYYNRNKKLNYLLQMIDN
ncbi:MAG: hypothetical protein CFE24_15160 [Flavobacterium sp. BFFFF2]|nr:MAG: hypothetical protein CFE24_15160 [Flavobacterium sp. BFFFF2]